MPLNFLYTAWFRDNALQRSEQHYEWPACIVIDAASEKDAVEWGDHLATKRVSRSQSEVLLSSSAEYADTWPRAKIVNVPRIRYGDEIPADEIGW